MIVHLCHFIDSTQGRGGLKEKIERIETRKPFSILSYLVIYDVFGYTQSDGDDAGGNGSHLQLRQFSDAFIAFGAGHR